MIQKIHYYDEENYIEKQEEILNSGNIIWRTKEQIEEISNIEKSFSCDLVGFNNKEKKEFLEIYNDLNGNYDLLNENEFFINNKIVRFHNKKIILLPEDTEKIENYNIKNYDIVNYYNEGGKEFYLFKNKNNQSLYLYQNNNYILLDSSLTRLKDFLIDKVHEESGTIVFQFKTTGGGAEYKTAILNGDNTLNFIPFKKYEKFEKIINVGEIKVFKDIKYNSQYYINEEGEWAEYKFFPKKEKKDDYFYKEEHSTEGRNENILFSSTINGKNILLSKYLSDRTLLVDNEDIQLPENMGEIEKITEYNGKILFFIKDENDYLENDTEEHNPKDFIGKCFLLDNNGNWEKPFNYPDKELTIFDFDLDTNIEGGKIFSFGANKIIATLLENNTWNILKDTRKGNIHYKSIYKSEKGEIYFIYMDSIFYEGVYTGKKYSEIYKFYNDSIKSLKNTITLEGIIEIIEEYDSNILIKLDNNKYSILNNSEKIIEFNIDGNTLKEFQIITEGKEKRYVFIVNGSTKIYNENEFKELYNKNMKKV